PTNLQKESVPEKMKSESIDATTKSEIITPRKIEPQITPSKVAESKPEEVTTISEQHKPSKEFMITSELVETATEAWKQVGKPLFNYVNGEREFQGYLQEVIVFEKNRLGYSIVSEIDVSQDVIDKIFHQIKPLWITEEYIESAKKRREFVIQEVQESLRIPKDVALHISKLQEFTNFRNIDFPLANCTINAPEMIGVIPLEKIRIKRGNPACKIEDILEPESYRTAPWADNFSKFEYNPIGKTCYHNYGMKIGKILAVVYHPLLGKVLLIGKDEPNKSLINYLVQRLNLQNEDIDDRKWLVKYLIAKQLNIPEGEALTPKTLIDYSLRRGFPILPNEILNSFRIFASAGSLEKINKKEVIFRNSTRLFHPSEIFPLKCLRIRNLNGKHIGTCIGISLSDKPVLLISEKLSRDVVKLFSSKKVEREIMNDISESVIGTLGVDVKDSLCTHNILKTLIVTKKIQTLEEYGKILSKLSVTGISLSQIAIVEKGTVYIKDSITQKSSTGNIFDQT
ncbi:MAG: hypothetical protein U9O98_02250, partial [Asgard group archaeon]|nr:hypothetical protein [Asgard group archaeon]